MARPGRFKLKGNQRGMALFMVIVTVGTLSLLLSEFTYVAQVNLRMAHNRLDQVKALYLAKSAYKLSMLRIKAYLTVKAITEKNAQAKAFSSMIDQIWSFPFIYPLPADAPGVTAAQADRINAFTEKSTLEGSFTALIESQSSRINLNALNDRFQTPFPKTKQPPASPPPGEKPQDPPKDPTFSKEEAQKSLSIQIERLFKERALQDEAFEDQYSSIRPDDLANVILSWMDRSYEAGDSFYGSHAVSAKKAPFFSMSELHMLPLIDDKLYDLLASAFTVRPTQGVNVNTMGADTLRMMFPKVTALEVEEFFKYRDDPDKDNHFQSEDTFFDQVMKFKDPGVNKKEDLKADLFKRGILIITQEQEFKITVRATVNQVTNVLTADLSILPKGAKPQRIGERKFVNDLRVTGFRIQ